VADRRIPGKPLRQADNRQVSEPADDPAVDDVRLGRILRALRRRRGLTQSQLGARVGLSQSAISMIERGHGSTFSGATLRRVFAALDARWEPTVSWRAGELDRLLDEDHARLVAATVRQLIAAGWDVVPEASYSIYGERGSVDVLACQRGPRAILVVEVKSDLTTIEGTIRKTDEKARIARRHLAQERFGIEPAIVGRLLILPSITSARSRVARSADVLDAAFPARGTTVRRWLRRPTGNMAGILFVRDMNPGNRTHQLPGRKRVRRRPVGSS
jgi:transcriptional regulator with XRE-family HTH domain